MGKKSLSALLREVRACSLCAAHLPNPPRPVLVADPRARLLIIGQAPGRRVHASGVPWDDPSGERLRGWLGIGRELFYDARQVAIVPMGFCYPGTGRSGDLPPRPECAATWHAPILERLPRIELVLLLSQYAQRAYLGGALKSSLAETVRAFEEYGPRFLPLPHPSPRNNRWLKTNAWFERRVVPELRRRVQALLLAERA